MLKLFFIPVWAQGGPIGPNLKEVLFRNSFDTKLAPYPYTQPLNNKIQTNKTKTNKAKQTNKKQQHQQKQINKTKQSKKKKKKHIKFQNGYQYSNFHFAETSHLKIKILEIFFFLNLFYKGDENKYFFTALKYANYANDLKRSNRFHFFFQQKMRVWYLGKKTTTTTTKQTNKQTKTKQNKTKTKNKTKTTTKKSNALYQETLKTKCRLPYALR